jgi:hypothetical protein
MMKALDASAAVTLRDNGGVYSVPAPYAETIRRFQVELRELVLDRKLGGVTERAVRIGRGVDRQRVHVRVPDLLDGEGRGLIPG